MQKRKISFNWLHLSKKVNGEEVFENVEIFLPTFLEYICRLDRVQRKYDLTRDKFCFIESYRLDASTHCVELLFKSAKHSYRAPLLDKNTVEERDNPKRIEEGEQVKTHLLLKFLEEDAIVFLETGLNLMTMANIVEYLNNFLVSYNNAYDEIIEGRFSFDMIPRDDFQEVLDSMTRVVCAEIFVDKTLLGSDALNFSNITENVQENLILTLKSEKKKSIKQTLCQIVRSFNGTQSRINRIRVKGRMPNNNESIIDTSFIIKKEYVVVEQNEDTGEFNTSDMFAQLRFLANGF